MTGVEKMKLKYNSHAIYVFTSCLKKKKMIIEFTSRV